MDHPKPWLRYVDAKDLEDKDKTLKFSGMEVDDPAGEKLGKAEGFVIDDPQELTTVRINRTLTILTMAHRPRDSRAVPPTGSIP